MTKRKFSQASRKKRKKKRPVVVAQADGEVYWKVLEVRGFRQLENQTEYLIHWENWPEDTWEHEDNLCDTVLADALAYRAKEEEQQLGIARAEAEAEANNSELSVLALNVAVQPEKAPLAPEVTPEDKNGAVESDNETVSLLQQTEGALSDRWDWSTKGHLTYQKVERLDVNDLQTSQRVKEARCCGIPVCLVGHKGWAQFAESWLTKNANENGLLDLSLPHSVDIAAMEEDIGDESIPIRRKRDVHGKDPYDKRIMLKTFLKNGWPKDGCDSINGGSSSNSSLYLHQWQFPVSDTAVEKLCGAGKHMPLPCLGEDLLSHWHGEDRFKGDNPYQYIFMGGAGTFSQLHRDPGGLLITIAPIVGKKEVVMAHRADGPSSLYHLEAKLDTPDLHRHPLMPTTRLWKTTLSPGEILIMPQGTYHQCRNETSCLSYHRFILDTTNLRPFLESHFDQDAAEIEHLVVLWNAACELKSRIDQYVEKVRRRKPGLSSEDMPDTIVQAVEALRMLRHIIREVEIRLESEGDSEIEDWHRMVGDIDCTLHSFQYRHVKYPPRFQRVRRKPRVSTALDQMASLDLEEGQHEELSVSFDLQKLFRRARKLESSEEFVVVSDATVLCSGHAVWVKLHGAKLRGEILERRDSLKAAFVKYDDYDEFNGEFLPLNQLRVQVAGETMVCLGPNDTKAGRVVYAFQQGESYRGKIVSLRQGTFYRVAVEVNGKNHRLARWLHRESFLGTIEKEESSSSAAVARPLHISPSKSSPARRASKKMSCLVDGVEEQRPGQNPCSSAMSPMPSFRHKGSPSSKLTLRKNAKTSMLALSSVETQKPNV